MDKKSHRQPWSENSHKHGIHYAHSPYWKRAHYDWRFWIVVLLMLGAMVTYVTTQDLAWRPRLSSETPLRGGLIR